MAIFINFTKKHISLKFTFLKQSHAKNNIFDINLSVELLTSAKHHNDHKIMTLAV